MSWLFISFKKQDEWRFEASRDALVENMVVHAMNHFRVDSDDEHFLEFRNSDGEWVLARDDQRLHELDPEIPSGTPLHMRLVRAT